MFEGRLPNNGGFFRPIKVVADVLSGLPNVGPHPGTVQTNIIIVRFTDPPSAVPRIVRECGRFGVLISDSGGNKLRITTHFDVSDADCRRAADIVADVQGRSHAL